MLNSIPSEQNITANKFDCNQGLFKRNTANCWFASALSSYANNVSKKAITKEFMREIEEEAYKRFMMPKGPLTSVGGIERISVLLNTNKDLFHFGGLKFHRYLNKGYIITVSITISDTFISQWRSGGVIVGGKGKRTGGHVLCLYKENGKYYFLNSWGGNPIRQVDNLYIHNVFNKNATCGVILP